MISSSNISNPNLVSQIASLKHLNDDQLKNYINDKSNPLSPYALSTLQSKTIARKKFGTPEEPKQTVADKVEAEADAPLPSQQGLAGLQPQGAPTAPPPQQVASLSQAPAPQGMAGGGMVAFDEGGVASLPLRDDMYNEDSFAHGGIVGFANRGSVEYQGLTQESFDKLSPEQQQLYTDSYRNKQIMGNAGKAILTPGVIAGGLEANAGIGINNLLTPVGKALGITHPLTKDIPYHSFDEMVPEMGTYPRTPKELRALLPPTGKPPTGKPPAATQDPIAPIVVPPAVPASIEKTTVANPLNDLLAARSSLGSSGSPYTIHKAEVSKYDIPSDFSNAEHKANRIQALADAGVDPNFYEKQVAKNEVDRQKLKGERTDAGWTAALRAGLGMMGGKSQNPWANIAEGATAGLAQYGTDIKDIKSDEKLLRAADDKLAEAQYLQSRGDAEGAMKAKAERDALIIQAKGLNTQAANAANIGYANAQNEQGKSIYTTQSAERIAQLSKDTQVAIANADINSREKIANLENTRAISTAQAKAYSDVVDEVTKQFTAIHGKDAQSTLPEGSDPQIVYNQMLRKALVARGLAPLSSNDAQYQVVASRPDTKK